MRSIAGAGVALAYPVGILGSELSSDITQLSASQLSAAIAQRQVSCVEVMQKYLDRIHRYNPVYNAIVSMLDDDTLLTQAGLADKALSRGEYWGWMHGMPHAVKDLANAAGLLSSYGSPIFAGTEVSEDDFMIGRIRKQGAIFIGKTNVPEFGMGSQSYNPVFGATGSAYDPDLTAGGSSGGAACGLGTQMLPVADGGDLMGSLRNPGAFNNVIGFRPTQGRVPDGNAGDLFYQKMGTGGPMGRNSEDTIRLLHSLAGHHQGQPLSLRDPLPNYEAYNLLNLKGLKMGWMGDFEGHLPTEPGVLEVCAASLRTLEQNGAIVEPCRPDFDMNVLWETWLTLRHWTRHGMRDLYDDTAKRKLLKPEAVWEIEGSLNTTAAQVYKAGIARSQWYREVHKLLATYDFLVLPTAQVFPFSKETHWPAEIEGTKMDTYHRWMEVVIGATLAGIPVCNVPAGFDPHGRPMGMQIMGRFGDDQHVLEFAMSYEVVTDHLQRRPVMQAVS
ncbi:MAG: amidase [Gammaproteobacteria bacterium]|nr:amidase [Gammaproteobacteria bacterium]